MSGGFEVGGRTALVTGAARGFGREFAERLLGAGAKVCITDLLEEEGRKTERELRDKFGDANVLFAKCDVTKREEWDSAWKEAEEKLGGVTLLVNNAGVPPEAGWRTCMEVMGKGAFLGTEVAMEKMGREKGGQGGRIVNVASVLGVVSPAISASLLFSGYCAAKAANISLTRMFADKKLVDKTGIKCFALCPMLADTKMFAEAKTRIESEQKMRALRVDELGDALMHSLSLDKSGAALLVSPDSPMLDLPNGTLGIMLGHAAVARALWFLGHRPAVQSPAVANAVLVAVLFVAFYLLQCLAGWMLC